MQKLEIIFSSLPIIYQHTFLTKEMFQFSSDFEYSKQKMYVIFKIAKT